MEFYNILKTKKININFPDIYFTPEYGKACEESDKGIWELCVYKDLMFCYLKKLDEKKIITPYGYSGFHYKDTNTFNEFIPKFREYLNSIGIKEEIIRQSPYINDNIKINQNYNLIKEKTIFGVNLEHLDTNIYLKKTNKTNRRMINLGIKYNLEFIISDFTDIDEFHLLYTKGMNQLKATSSYMYNKKYFEYLSRCNVKNAKIIHNNTVISTVLLLLNNNFIHYHLGVSELDYRKLGTNNFLHFKIIEYAINNNFKLYILGGGLENNDNLFKFKKRISNIEFKYQIFKNVL